MRTLSAMLKDRDAGFLKILTERWGFAALPGALRPDPEALAQAMLDPTALQEMVEGLPDDARLALQDLLAHSGRIPFTTFTLAHGPLREMGPGRRDREQPWRHPISASERLWYLGLIGRAFADSTQGPLEYVYLPRDLRAQISLPAEDEAELPGSPAPEPAQRSLADSGLLDDATTILAALRRSPVDALPLPPAPRSELKPFLLRPASLDLALHLLIEFGALAGPPLSPDPDRTRAFLDAPRGESLAALVHLWAGSQTWNDLAATPGIMCAKEEWPNDPQLSRKGALRHLRPLPMNTWWNISAFVEALRASDPAFQRPSGEFDSWYLTDSRTGTFLRGISFWDRIEGEFLRHLITGPMHWLGLVDLGREEGAPRPTSFRLTPACRILWDEQAELHIEPPEGAVTIRSDGVIHIPRAVARTYRYQIARICEWSPLSGANYRYRLSPRSLRRAAEQGLQLSHILPILEKAASGGIPPSLVMGLERWQERGAEARIERTLVLRTQSPDVLEELQAHNATRRLIQEVIGPTAARIREQDWPRLCEQAARHGLLIDAPEAGEANPGRQPPSSR